MIPGGRRVARQQGQVILVVAGLANAVIHNGGEVDDAVEAEAALLEQGGDCAVAQSAVAFAEQEFGRGPAVVEGDVALDGAGEGVGILVDAPEVAAGLLAQGPRPAGADRVDEDEIAGVDQRIRVGAEAVGGRPDIFGIGGGDPHRREAAHVQPHRRGAGPAIVEEGDRPAARRRSVARIGRVEDRGGRLAFVVAKGERSGRRGVGDARAAPESHRAVADRSMLIDRRAHPGILDIGDERVAVGGGGRRPRGAWSVAAARRFLGGGGGGGGKEQSGGENEAHRINTPKEGALPLPSAPRAGNAPYDLRRPARGAVRRGVRAADRRARRG